MSLTLPEFLARALDADEAAARGVMASWAREFKATGEWPLDSTLVEEGLGDMDYPALTINPARVLAEVASKRAILALHVPTRWSPAACEVCVSFHADMDCENEAYPCPTLRHLAAPYSSEPDFDPSWAVS